MSLRKEDYQEPCCPMNTDMWKTEPAVRRIDIRRVTERLDALFAAGDFQGAERLLSYWRAEAEDSGDLDGCLQMENESMGFFRKQGRGTDALQHAARALELAAEPGMEELLIRGTTFLNAATVHVAFDPQRTPQQDEAMPLFEEAKRIYEKKLQKGDTRLAGLYNNMASAFLKRGEPEQAAELFEQALSVLGQNPGKQCDRAITCLNLADAMSALGEEEKKNAFLADAWELLDAPDTQRDSYYRFVCEKCAPVFEYYGWFAAAGELEDRIR